MIRWKIHKIKTSLLKKTLPTKFLRSEVVEVYQSFTRQTLPLSISPKSKTSFLTKKRGGKNRGPRRTRLSSTHLVFFLEDFYGCLWNSHHLQGWRYCPVWCRCHVILRCHHRRGRCHGWHHHPGRARGTGLGHGVLGGISVGKSHSIFKAIFFRQNSSER